MRRSKVTTSTSTPAGFTATVCPSIRNDGGLASASALRRRDERVAETTARLVVALLAPQQGGELVAGVALAGSNGEVGEQGLSLLRR